MSICRWSCDNYMSDLYAYEGQQGYVVHVAGQRLIGEPPTTPPLTPENIEDGSWQAANVARCQWLEACSWTPIGLSRDGRTLLANTIEELHDLLLDLRDEGYHVPLHALATVEEEHHAT